MIRKIVLFFVVISVVSCKTKAIVATGTTSTKLAAAAIIANNDKNPMNFSTAYIKSSVDYKDPKQSQSLSAEIKIQKDKNILVSVRFLGITMAKALITPDKVQYYEKINGEYFEGDFTTLSRWLGVPLDFDKVQRILLGQPFEKLNGEDYNESVNGGFYQLQSKGNTALRKTFLFEAANFLLKKQQVQQPTNEASFQVEYPVHQSFPQAFMPQELNIEATQRLQTVTIKVLYTNINFNESMTFPYSVPSGYKQIEIEP